MSLFAISDLHLSFGADKPMNIFKGWDDYVEKIEKNWRRIVTDSDTVVLPGDFSWGLKLEETKKDFEFLNALPGRKIILKGNHDLWWGTVKKLKEFFEENGFDTVDVVFNNAAVAENCAIAGTRGWFYDDAKNEKILLREAARLDTSLTAAEETGLPVKAFLHYPPVYGDMVCHEIFDVIKKHGISEVWYGHIHGSGIRNIKKEYDGVKFRLVSCDCVDFTPVLVCK